MKKRRREKKKRQISVERKSHEKLKKSDIAVHKKKKNKMKNNAEHLDLIFIALGTRARILSLLPFIVICI